MGSADDTGSVPNHAVRDPDGRPPHRTTMRLRTLWTLAVASLLVLAASGVAAAHVTEQPPVAEQGSYAKLTFRVPNERPVGTVELRVQMPEDQPFASVSTKPVPGWSAEVVRQALDTPIESHGRQITEVVSEIRWTGGPIEPGQFQEFEVSVGPLPDDVDELAFPAIQTYADGEEVAWIEPVVEGDPEPERPAPRLRLVSVDASGDDDGDKTSPTTTAATTVATEGDDEPSDVLGIVSLVVAGGALVVAVAALVAARSRRD
jgi:uncharacterized protein YcnI